MSQGTATSHEAAFLQAGALLEPDRPVPDSIPCEAVTARTYVHPALGDVPVVRLVAEDLVEGVDIEMDYLGFDTSATATTGAIATRQQQALGFPAWAMVHDPEHAGYALKVVKRLKKAAARARSKPGHAQDDFIAIADELGKSVPHFLPSYWEEVGRVYGELGNTTYAARAFSKAREAEEVHALNIDEDQRARAYVEFALLGAMTIKALNHYAQSLIASMTEPEDAWRRYRAVIVQRTKGGLPPWPALGKDIRKVLKATGLDVAAEERALIADLLGAPAITRAPLTFWQHYSTTIQKLVHEDRAAAVALFNARPAAISWQWLAFLSDWDLLELLDDPEALPDGSIVTWFNSVLKVCCDDWDWGAAIVPDEIRDLFFSWAEPLKEDGRAVVLFFKDMYDNANAGLDMLEDCLRLGIPVADPDPDAAIDLTMWCAETDEGYRPDRIQDPSATAADERFTELLQKAVGAAMGDENFERLGDSMPVIAELRQRWLDRALDDLEQGGLIAVNQQLTLLAEKTSPALFTANPTARERLEAFSIVPALQRVLQGGIVDEYGWPALEAAHADLLADGGNPDRIHFRSCPPYLTLHHDHRAIAIGPEGRIATYDIAIPKGAKLEGVMYFAGEFLVFAEQGYETHIGWSGSPGAFTKPKHYLYMYRESTTHGFTFFHEKGAFTGDQLLIPGETPSNLWWQPFAIDGDRCWRSSDSQWFSYDIETGTTGRQEMPAWFEEGLADDQRIDAESSYLLPAPDGTPFGSAKGSTGFKVHRPKRGHGPMTITGVDGRTWTATTSDHTPAGLVDWPGHAEPLVILPCNSYQSGLCQEGMLYDPATGITLDAFGNNPGQPVAITPALLHVCEVRDSKLSDTLRSIDTDTVASLIDTIDAAEVKEQQAAITSSLAPDGHPGLIAGIVGQCQEAVRLQQRHQKLVKRNKGENISIGPSIPAEVIDGFDLLGWKRYSSHQDFTDFLTSLRLLHQSADDDTIHEQLSWEMVDCLDGIANIRCQLWALLHQTDAEQRQKLAAAVDHLADLDLTTWIERVRTYKGILNGPMDPAFTFLNNHDDEEDEDERCRIACCDGRVHLVQHYYDNYWQCFEYAPDSTFVGAPGMRIGEATTTPSFTMTATELRSWAACLRDDNEPVIDTDIITNLASRLSVDFAVAALLMTACPESNAWDKNFLPKPLRTALGLKVVEADQARDTLKELGEDLWATVETIQPFEPSWLFTDTQALADALAATLASTTKRNVAIEADVKAQIERLLVSTTIKELDDWSQTISQMDAVPGIDFRFRRRWGEYYSIILAPEDFDKTEHPLRCNELIKVLGEIPRFTGLVHELLPVDHPATALAATMLEQARQIICQGDMLLPVARISLYDEDTAAADSNGIAERFLALGGTETARQRAANLTCRVIDTGWGAVGIDHDEVTIAARPGAIETEHQWDLLFGLLNQTAEQFAKTYNSVRTTTAEGLRQFWRDAYGDLVTALKEPAGTANSYAIDPLQSAPDLVATVAATHDIDTEAATLYLQLLTLPRPTKKVLAAINGWKPRQFKQAAAQLIERDLVIEAKRKRAGRDWFLPGGWEDRKAPDLPIETWKLSLYDNDACISHRPWAQLFATAWQRIVDGDLPRYEEVS